MIEKIDILLNKISTTLLKIVALMTMIMIALEFLYVALRLNNNNFLKFVIFFLFTFNMSKILIEIFKERKSETACIIIVSFFYAVLTTLSEHFIDIETTITTVILFIIPGMLFLAYLFLKMQAKQKYE